MFTLLIIGLGFGLIAAAIEVLLVRTYQKNVIVLSAIGSHWVAVGALMPFIEIDAPVWLKGMLVGVVLTVPFMIYEIQQSRNAVIHTLVFAPIWGMVLAYGVHVFS